MSLEDVAYTTELFDERKQPVSEGGQEQDEDNADWVEDDEKIKEEEIDFVYIATKDLTQVEVNFSDTSLIHGRTI